MLTVILISTVAIIVAIVGCFVIWRLDASRAEEIDNEPAAATTTRHELDAHEATTPPRSLDT